MSIGSVRADMQFGGTWQNITADVLTAEGIKVVRGRADETSSTLDACSASLALKNPTGTYTPANPAGPYYGQLRVGTPFRLGVGVPPNAAFAASAQFATTLIQPNVTTEAPGLLICAAASYKANSLGYSTSGLGVSYAGQSGNVSMSASGAIATGVAGSYGSAYGATDSTAGTSGSQGVACSVAIPGPTSTAAIIAQKQAVAPGSIGGSTPTVALPTFASVAAGDVIVAVLAWSSDASNSMFGAPLDDQVEAEWEILTDTGPSSVSPRMQVWIRQCPRAIPALNLGVFGHINHAEDLHVLAFQVRGATAWSPRFHGEAGSFDTAADLAGGDIRVAFQAGSVVRRRGQGQEPNRSALYRSFAFNAAGTVGYWPLETNTALNQQGSSVLNSPLPGVSPAIWSPNASGAISYGANSSIPASDSLPTIANGALTMPVPAYSKVRVGGVYNASGLVTAVFEMAAAPNPGVGLLLINLLGAAAGVPSFIQVAYTNTTTLTLTVFDINKAVLGGSAFTLGLENVSLNGSQSFIGTPFAITVSWTVSNVGVVNLAWNVANMSGTQYYNVPLQGFSTLIGPFAATSDGRCASVTTGVDVTGTIYSGANPFTVGHVTVSQQGAYVNTTGIYIPVGSALPTAGSYGVFVAWASEDAESRIVRLSQEEGIISGATGAGTTGIGVASLGPQYPDTALNLITEAWLTDGGELFEARGYNGLHYRALSALSGMAAATTLDFAAKEVSNPFTPTTDDQHVRNDVTVSQRNGGQARAYQATGPYSVLPPPSGSGTYTDSVTVNVAHEAPMLQRTAEWRVHLGTDGSTRFGTLTSLLAAVPNSAMRIADIDVGQRVRLLNPPVWAAPGPIDLYVLGMSETIGDVITSDWSYVLNVIPFRPYQVLVPGGNSTGEFGRLDFAAATLSAPATSSATSVTITSAYTADFPVSASCPFDVLVAGEQMTVTGVGTPSGGTQVLTVTRSVNGVVKAQVAGTAVNVAQPAYLGLN